MNGLRLGPAPSLSPLSIARGALAKRDLRRVQRRLPSRPGRLTVCTTVALGLGATVEASAAPDGSVYTHDIRHSALTAQPGTLELGVFSYSRYAVNERLELSLHPLGLLLWPQVDAKVRWADCGPFTFSTQHSLAYPAWFLEVAQREGTGGLVDPNVDVPVTFQMDAGLLATYHVGRAAWATLNPFVQVGLGSETPVLEFPFLYQRLAAVASGYAWGLNAALEGIVGTAVGYEVSATYFELPLDTVQGAFAVESLLEVRLLLSDASTLPLGVRFSHAQFPYGRRSHWFPYIDYRLIW